MVILTGIQICLTSIEPPSPLKTYSFRQDGLLQRKILAPSAFCVKTFPYLFLESHNPSGEALYSLFNVSNGKTEESRDIQMTGMRILGSLDTETSEASLRLMIAKTCKEKTNYVIMKLLMI